jgi:hypothetical protein
MIEYLIFGVHKKAPSEGGYYHLKQLQLIGSNLGYFLF